MRSILLRPKTAYGWDQKGEVVDNGQMNIEDTATPMSQHKTPTNPVNSIGDVEAERQFPGLGEHKHSFPPRGRN